MSRLTWLMINHYKQPLKLMKRITEIIYHMGSILRDRLFLFQPIIYREMFDRFSSFLVSSSVANL